MGVCHSRPRECQGLGVDGRGSMNIDHTKLTTKMMNEAPRKKALTDAMSLRVWRFWAYSKTRRGWPRSPTRKRGKNVRLKKMNIAQKCHLPSRSLICFPVIFGSQ